MTRSTFVALSLVLVAGSAQAQSLGDVARQEASRRKSIVSAGRIYTNADLPALPVDKAPSAVDAPSLLSAPDVQPESTSAATAPSFDDRDEHYWRERGSALNRRIESARADATAVAARLATFAGPSQERTLTEAALRTVEADLRALEDDWLELQTQALAAKVPLLWLR